jgi:hemoglobin-like flavoprotein
MNPEQIVLVQESFEHLLPVADATADMFYRRLFALTPEVQALFPEDLTAQRRKFIASLQAVVDALWRPEDLEEPLRMLGARHVGYGVQPEHYAPVGIALIDAIEEQLGPFGSPPVIAAWQAAYDLVVSAMTAE